MKKINWKLLGIILLWTIGLSSVIVSLAFTEVKQQDVLCKSVEVEINRDDENYFISKQDILKILFSAGDTLIGTRVDKIPVSLLERLIKANKYVESADVFIDLKGNLSVDVHQRKPVLRVINYNQQGYYIDDAGLKMPLSQLYSARVLIATGSILEDYNGKDDSVKSHLVNSLYAMSNFIRSDEFWDAQIEQVYIEENQDITLVPRVGNHKIIFGDTSNMVEKFENLLTFYRKALPKVGWDTYNTISVKFKGQLVCIRNDKALPVLPFATSNDSTIVGQDSVQSVIETEKN